MSAITLVNGETYDGPIYYTWPGFTNQLVLPINAGSYTIKASIAAQGNYTRHSVQFYRHISRCRDNRRPGIGIAAADGHSCAVQHGATLTIKASDQTITYGQSITEGTGQVTATGLCAGDSLSGITLAASTRNVPGGTIELSAAQIKNSSGGDVTANYNITYEAGTLTINKAQATVTGDPTANTLTYTGAAQALAPSGCHSPVCRSAWLRSRWECPQRCCWYP